MAFLIVLIIVVPVLMLILLVNISGKASAIETRLTALTNELIQVKEKLLRLEKSSPAQETETTYGKEDLIARRNIRPEPVAPPPAPEETPVPFPVPGPVAETTPVSPEPVVAVNTASGSAIPDEWDERKAVVEHMQRKEDNWWSSRENMEEFIGGNLANKIGIGVLVLGIAFFVKYAIDKDWINETGRVSIGLFCGALLIGVAHRIRKRYRAFSSVLVGGGLAVLYFSIAFAFHAYQLIGQQGAFSIMLLTTAFAVVLALYYNRMEIAILALLGGFATPFLASTGNDNYVALFTYLAILCAGMTVLSWFKKWPAINIISIIGTTLIFGGWLVNRVWIRDPEAFPFRDGLLFATLYFLLFIGMNMLNNLRMKRGFAGLDYLLVLSTQLFYYASGMLCIDYWDHPYAKGVFTAALGVFNLLLALIFKQVRTVDRNFVWLLAGLGITFIALFAAVQLNGHEITLFWAAESLLLFALFGRTGIPMLSRASLILQMLALGSLVVIWATHYLLGIVNNLPVIINKAFITSVCIAAAVYLRCYLLTRFSFSRHFVPGISPDLGLAAFYPIIAFSILFFGGLWEVMYQFHRAFPQSEVYWMYTQLYLVSMGLLLTFLARRTKAYPFVLMWVIIGSFAVYIGSITANQTLQYYLADNGIRWHFWAHWAMVVVMLAGGCLAVRFFRNPSSKEWIPYRRLFTWVVSLSLITLLSVELYQVNLALYLSGPDSYPNWENLFYRAQLSILWSLCAFVMIWLGLRYKYQPMRIISLMIFVVTLLKLFLYDIRNIPPGGKIASFILLGVLLLIISFMYQRIKAMLVDEGKR